MKKVVKIVGIIVIILALLAGGFFFVLPRVAAAQSTSTSTTYTTQAAALGDLSTYVSGTGNVRPKQTATLSWQTSGNVGSILVKQGDTVTTGEMLATLVDSSLPQAVINAQIDLAEARKNLENVLDNSQTRANAEAALVAAQAALTTAENNSKSLQYQTASQDTIDIARASLIIAQENQTKAEQRFNQVQHTSTTDPNYDVSYANALSQLASARQATYLAQVNLDYLQNLPSLTDIQSINATLDQAKANLAAAQAAWDLVKDGPDPAAVATAQAKVTAAQAVLNEAHVAATFNGTVTDVYAVAGNVVSTGTNAIKIADLSQYLVDVSVSEVDITSVAVGQAATITFDAISGKTYNGVVSTIPFTGTNSGGSVNYSVTVTLTDPDNQIKSGMSASVDIAVKALKDVLVVPISALRTVGTDRVVYILQNNVATPVVVTLGSTTDTSAQVATGNLKVGDLIITNPPSATTTTSSSSSSNIFSGLFSSISNLFGGTTTSSGPGGGMPAGGPPSGSPPSGGPGGSSSGSSTGGN
jgi:RND family efflux transporter MFP subunit